jgi:tRNA A-37 threonylcarbamoyl transferase component Bud32
MSPFMELTCGSVHWQIDRDLLRTDVQGSAGGLFHENGPCVEDWLHTGQATLVKHGPHQSVYHVVLPGLDVHLKHYRLANTRAWLRSFVRPPKGQLEFERTRTAAAKGLPTLAALAVGQMVGGDQAGSSYLVTRTLASTVPLSKFLEAKLPSLDPLRRTRIRQRIAVAVGELLARMHHAGVTYHDLHPGNLLLQLDDIDQPHLYLIDLYAVTFGPPLSSRQRRDNLVILNRWFVLRSDRSDRLRCWHAYEATCKSLFAANGRPPASWWERLLACIKRTTFSPPGATAVRQLEQRTVSSNIRFWRHLDRRCLRSNRHFRRVQRGDVVGHVVADLDPVILDRLLNDPDQPFRDADAKPLKDSRSSTVIELGSGASADGAPLIFKRFAVTHWRDPLASLLRATPALRSFVQGHGLSLRCLPTARPLAVFHRQRHGLRHEGYLLTEKVENALDLLALINRLRETDADERRLLLRRLIAEVARLVCTLHQRRMSHRDLKAANLLVQTEPATQSVRVWFIDLVGVVRQRRLRRGRRVQNLARLHTSFHAHPLITRTDKLRFLRVYLRWGLRSKLGWKTWWRQVEEATRAKIARNLRNGRPLG